MPKDTGRNDRRSRIAHLAARLMAQDGIEDYAHAKRKAARQAGMPETRELPTNEEVEEALRTYQQIYHHEEHRNWLRVLRETAQYESPMFWCSQLFYEGWKPVPSPPQCV